MTAPSDQIVVIVCTHNGSRHINACLDALADQTHRAPIIVVDDGSTDNVAELAKQHRSCPTVIQLTPNQGLSAARNAGIAASTSELVAFTDDDCTPTSTWVADLLTVWQEVRQTTDGTPIVGIGGHTTPHRTDTFNRRYLDANNPLTPLELTLHNATVTKRLATYLSWKPKPTGRRPVYSLVGANMSFTREALNEVGGFDPVIRFGGDEEHLCRRLRAKYGNHTLIADSTILIKHAYEPGLRDTFRRAYAYGKGHGRDWARHGGHPAVQPAPVLTVAALLIGTTLIKHGKPVGALTVLTPWVIFSRWLTRAVPRRTEALSYPLIELATETATNTGFIAGWWKTRKHRQ